MASETGDPSVSLRLDLYLKRTRLVKRRALTKKMCESGMILVNGTPARPAKAVRAGDVIGLPRGKAVRIEALPLEKSADPTRLWYETLPAGNEGVGNGGTS